MEQSTNADETMYNLLSVQAEECSQHRAKRKLFVLINATIGICLFVTSAAINEIGSSLMTVIQTQMKLSCLAKRIARR